LIARGYIVCHLVAYLFSYQFLQVINAYAYIANVENDKTAFISTFQSQELSGEHGEFDPKKERSWIKSVGKRCLTRQMVSINASGVLYTYFLVPTTPLRRANICFQ
jgi:hypothetical protein